MDVIGEWIGRVLNWLATNLGAVWDGFWGLIGSFFAGLFRGIGLEDAGVLAWIGVLSGLLFLYFGARSLYARSFFAGFIQIVLGLAIIGAAVS